MPAFVHTRASHLIHPVLCRWLTVSHLRSTCHSFCRDPITRYLENHRPFSLPYPSFNANSGSLLAFSLLCPHLMVFHPLALAAPELWSTLSCFRNQPPHPLSALHDYDYMLCLGHRARAGFSCHPFFPCIISFSGSSARDLLYHGSLL